MKHLSKILAVSSLALAASACDVNKTEEGEMPDVDVDAGEMPEYEFLPEHLIDRHSEDQRHDEHASQSGNQKNEIVEPGLGGGIAIDQTGGCHHTRIA